MKRNKVFQRMTSLLLVLMMIFTMLPMQAFAASPIGSNAGAQGTDADAKGYSASDWGAELKNFYGMRFSLYHAEGNWASYDEFLEAEKKGETEFKPLGQVVETWQVDKYINQYGQSMLGDDKPLYWSGMSVYKRMAEDNMSTFGLIYDDYKKHVIHIDTIDWQTPDPGDGAECGNNRKDKNFPIIIEENVSKGRYNEFFTGFADSNKDNWYISDVINAVKISEKILEGTGITVTEDSFKNGYYLDFDGKKVKGAFKLFFEPTYEIKVSGKRYVVTIRDIIAFEKAVPGMKFEFTEYAKDENGKYKLDNAGNKISETRVLTGLYEAFSSYTKSVGAAVHLIEDEPVIKMFAKKGSGGYSNLNQFSESADFYKSAGVGVITGFPRGEVAPPQIVKTYVSIESIDKDGNVTFKKAGDTTIETAKFARDSDGNLTVYPIFETTEVKTADSIAILNDVFTTPYDLDIGKDSEWVNTDLITNVGVKLDTTSKDIAGYLFGIVVNSDIFISALNDNAKVEWKTEDLVELFHECLLELLSQQAAFAAGFYHLSKLNHLERGLRLLQDVEITNVDMEKTAVEYTHHMTEDLATSAFKKEDIEKKAELEGMKFVRAGIIDEKEGQVVKLTQEYLDMLAAANQLPKELFDLTPANTVVLRYIVTPNPSQINIVKIYDESGALQSIRVESEKDLSLSNGTATIQDPTISLPSNIKEGPIVVKWVTNQEYPIKDVSSGDLPDKSINGKEGTSKTPISNYPKDPVPHNLYVEWKVVLKDPVAVAGSEDVPEWRLSKYIPSVSQKLGSASEASMDFTLTGDGSSCVRTTFTPNGYYSFQTVNANGKLNSNIDTSSKVGTPEQMSMVYISQEKISNYKDANSTTVFHSKTYSIEDDIPLINHDNTSADIAIDASLNMIKSYDTGKLVAANWITGNVFDLSKYSVNSGNKPLSYSNGTQYTEQANLYLGIYNRDTYVHNYTVWDESPCYHIFGCSGHDLHCECYTLSETFAPSDVTYGLGRYRLNIKFDRYIPENTDARKFNVEPKIKEENGFTSIQYQIEDVLRIYPEVGMLFDSDMNTEKVKWVVGDEDRLINPVVWQTLEHKVYVTPKSTGTSVANDSRALAASRKLVGLDNTANGKQMIYKGAAVNTAFEVNKDNTATKSKGILTFKTYALDFNDKYSSGSNNLKSAWGNSSYNSYTQHSVVLDYLTNNANNKATATEYLLVDSGNNNTIDYEGGSRTQKTNSYNLISYKGNDNRMKTSTPGVDVEGEAVVFNHELIIRGGALVGIKYNTRTKDKNDNTKWAYLTLPIQTDKPNENSLEKQDPALFNAVVGMGLYNVSNGIVNREDTVLCGFEYETGKLLYEKEYADELAKAREEVDGISTPPTSAIKKDRPWYSEDTTVLVIKEYVSNFEVPSISFSDKLSMSVKGLESPADKTKFFNVVGKGHTYLKYVLPICSPYKSSSGESVPTSKAYFEFSSSPAKKLGFGRIGVDYIVPNVSVSDTTRMN